MGFRLVADYHTHTKYSDGNGTIAENVESAVKLGLRTIGITDHGFFHVKAGIRRKYVAKMRAEIERLQKIYPDIEILLGIEANLINMRGDLDMTIEDFALFDYCIFGVHKFACSIKKPSSIWFAICNLLVKNSEKRKQKITDSYIKAIERYPVKYVVHPNYAARVDVPRLANFAASKGVWLELNGKRIDYSEQDIRGLLYSGVGLVIGSDAHSPDRVGEISIPTQFIEEHNIPVSMIVNIKIDN